MKILLVKPSPDKKSINLQSFMMCEPLELEYLSALLETDGHQTDIVDMVLEKSFKKIVKKGNYDVIMFTAYQIHIGVVKKYAKQVKEINKNTLVMVGGVHAEVVPQDFVNDNIDLILQNGMYRLLEILKDYKNGVKVDQLVKKASSSHLLTFNFPHPNRDKTKKYRKHYNYIYHDDCATIKTSFSCKYNCEFCFCTRVGEYFERDILDVVEELSSIKENNIFIVDDNFLYNKDRIIKFCNLLDEYKIKKTFIAFGRADFIVNNEDIVKLLSEHGFDAFFVGIESFKLDELNSFNKKVTVETNKKAIRILEKYDVQCYSGLIVGMDWDKKDFDSLIDYLNSFEHPMVNIQPITPIKGTPFYEKEKDKIIEKETNYHYFDMAHLVMQPTKLSKRKFYYNILRAYLKTVAAKKGRKYIVERYGKKVYNRVKKGAFKIALQYVKLIIKPN